MASDDAKSYYQLLRVIDKKISLLHFIRDQLNECFAKEEWDHEVILIYRSQWKELLLDLNTLIPKLKPKEQEVYSKQLQQMGDF